MMSPEAVAVKVVWKDTVELDQSMECAQRAPPESEWGLVSPSAKGKDSSSKTTCREI